MKRKIIFIAAVFIVFIFINNNNIFSQTNINKSNGTLEILAIYNPEFIVFRYEKSKNIKEIEIYLVDGANNYQSSRQRGMPSVKKDNNGNSIDMIETWAMNFAIPASEPFFKAKRIKFVVDGVTMFYNVEKAAWEAN